VTAPATVPVPVTDAATDSDRTALITAEEAAVIVSEWLPVGVSVTATSLQFDEPLEFTAWQQFGKDLEKIHRLQEARMQTVLWWIGDWLRYGEYTYGEKFAQAVEETGRAPQTLANLQWVASAIDPSRRRENLTHAHHAEVAALPEPDQDDLLDDAIENGYSAKTLREKAQDRRAENDGKDPDVERARRALDLALDKMKALGPEHWAGIIVKALVLPLRHECADVEYEAFVAHLWALTEEVLQ